MHTSRVRSRTSCVVAKHQSAPAFAGSSWVHERWVGAASLDNKRWNLASSGMCLHWAFGSLGHLATSGILEASAMWGQGRATSRQMPRASLPRSGVVAGECPFLAGAAV